MINTGMNSSDELSLPVLLLVFALDKQPILSNRVAAFARPPVSSINVLMIMSFIPYFHQHTFQTFLFWPICLMRFI